MGICCRVAQHQKRLLLRFLCAKSVSLVCDEDVSDEEAGTFEDMIDFPSPNIYSSTFGRACAEARLQTRLVFFWRVDIFVIHVRPGGSVRPHEHGQRRKRLRQGCQARKAPRTKPRTAMSLVEMVHGPCHWSMTGWLDAFFFFFFFSETHEYTSLVRHLGMRLPRK